MTIVQGSPRGFRRPEPSERHTQGKPTLLRCDAVLLDIDVTLVDSNAAHTAAWSDALAEHGGAMQRKKFAR
jgi:hypothetical protein